MKTISRLLLIASVALMITSCSDDDKNGSSALDGTFTTFVTYMGSGDGGSSFTVTEPGTDVLTTFTSIVKIPAETLKAGERTLINYNNTSGKRYQSGPITLRGYIKIFNGAAPRKPQGEIAGASADMIDVQALELSDTYINVVAQAGADAPLLFDLWIDEATVASDTPDAYVVFSTDTNSGQRMLYGSFDIAGVLNLPTCQAIRVHYMTDAGPETTTFPKGSQTIHPME